MATALLNNDTTEPELIQRLQAFLVQQGHRQRLAKRARRTLRTPPAERNRLLEELRLVDDLPVIQAYIDRQRLLVTVAHVIYGDLRSRPHPVSDPMPYRRLEESLVGLI